MLDWELSTLGDPLADFSYHLMQWHMPPSEAGTGSLVGFDLAALGIPSLAEYVEAYVRRTGLDPRPYLAVYSAYNFFRIAAILQGIVGRVRDGTATSAFAAAKADAGAAAGRQGLGIRAPGRRDVTRRQRMKTFALALGGGGARGLAHIAVIEALDEMGIKPVAIAGTSIGALIGAAYAAGMRGKDIRRHVIALRPRPGETMRRLIAGARRHAHRLFRRRVRSSRTDRRREILRAVPSGRRARRNFPGLQIPLTVMTTDLHRREEAALCAGPLHAALAASIAIPGLFRPVAIDERVLIDGGTTNPLPFDRLHGRADIIVAIDVLGQPPSERADIPGAVGKHDHNAQHHGQRDRRRKARTERRRIS